MEEEEPTCANCGDSAYEECNKCGDSICENCAEEFNGLCEQCHEEAAKEEERASKKAVQQSSPAVRVQSQIKTKTVSPATSPRSMARPGRTVAQPIRRAVTQRRTVASPNQQRLAPPPIPIQQAVPQAPSSVSQKPGWLRALLTLIRLAFGLPLIAFGVLWLIWVSSSMKAGLVERCVAGLLIGALPIGIGFLIVRGRAKAWFKYSVVTILVSVGLTVLLVRGCSKFTDSSTPLTPGQQPKESSKNAEVRTSFRIETLTPPKLDGTPFEALSKAQAWIAIFEKNVGQSLRATASSIRAGKAPGAELTTLEAHLTQNKQLVSSANGLLETLGQQQQRMTQQIKEVEKMTAQQGLDPSLKQQYADTLNAARKHLDAYNTCRENVVILAKRLDTVLAASAQWRQYFTSTAGITGEEVARSRLLEMIAKTSSEWPQ